VSGTFAALERATPIVQADGDIPTTLHNVHARLVALEKSLKAERQQEINRAVEFKNRGNRERASYHTGLADGQNSTIEALRVIRQYSAYERAAVQR